MSLGETFAAHTGVPVRSRPIRKGSFGGIHGVKGESSLPVGENRFMTDDFRWWSATETGAAIRTGVVGVCEVVDAAIARIERLNPSLGAVVIPLFERARQLSRLRPITSNSLFDGVPMLLKDAGEELADTPHWVGTRGLQQSVSVSTQTTELAHRFETLGFVFVGKSACPELSASSTTEPVGFPPTRNPWALDRTAGGSSGGAAAAVAAGLVPIAHGSDATGSLRFPAAHCGVVTLKPTRGRIPIVPPTGQADPLGVWTQFAIARDVEDLVTLFPLLARPSGTNSGAREPQVRERPLRIGLLAHDPIIGLPVAADCAQAIGHLGETLAALGHRVDSGYPPAFDTLFEPFWKGMQTVGPLVRFEQTEWMSKRLGRPCRAGDLSDELLELAERGRTMPVDAGSRAYSKIRDAMAGVLDWWSGGYDLLVTPVTLEPAWRIGEEPSRRTGMFCAPFSFTGQPALVVPVAISREGLPIGAQIVGRPGDDELLLQLGSRLQTALGWLDRKPK